MRWTVLMCASRRPRMPRFLCFVTDPSYVPTLQVRASKAEEEVAELLTKAQRLEVDLDKCKETLATRASQLDEKEKALLAAELEVSFPMALKSQFTW
jgi:hypothetical protein